MFCVVVIELFMLFEKRFADAIRIFRFISCKH